MLFLAFLKCQGTHSEDVMTVRTALLLTALLLPPGRTLARAAPASAALRHTMCTSCFMGLFTFYIDFSKYFLAHTYLINLTISPYWVLKYISTSQQ